MRPPTLSASILLTLCSIAARSAPPETAAELFQTDKVWTIHLTFTPEQWATMEPKSPEGGGFGGRGGMGGRGGFGPAMMVAPAFVNAGDADQDGLLSKDEFHGLAEKWFAAWDKASVGKITGEQLRLGLDATVLPQAGLVNPKLQGAEGQRNGVAGAAGVEFVYVHADLDFDGKTVKNVGVRFKGNGTWMQSRGQLKRSMKIDVNEYVKGQKLAGAVTTLNLHSNVTDAGFMNEVLSHRLYRDAGITAPRSAYARVYVTVPGKHDHQYFGLYSIIENPDKHFAAEAMGTKDGAIFKPVTPSLFADLGDDWAKYKQTYDPKTELTPKQIERVIGFARLVTSADDETFAARVGDYLDLDQFARYMAVTTWLSTLDSILGMGQNFYVYLEPRHGRFQFLPWDLDHSFGSFGMGASQEQREQLSVDRPWRGDNRFLERVFKVDAFKAKYRATFAELDKTVFRPERFAKQVDELAAVLRPAVAEESADKLARFERAISTGGVEPQRPAGGEAAQPNPQAARVTKATVAPNPASAPPPPQQPMGRGGFMQASKAIKAFVVARAQSVADQLSGKSKGMELNSSGGKGGPGAGPGNFLAPAMMAAFDANGDGQLTRDETTAGFDKWFVAWNADKSGTLTDEQLRAGINKGLSPQRGGGGPNGDGRGIIGRLFGGGGGNDRNDRGGGARRTDRRDSGRN
jgi:spore coat protein CotH